jgi:protein ImuA
VVWIAPAWLPERLCPAGLVRLLDPARVIFVQARRVDDLLWSLEEVLRSGAAAAAVAELPDPPALTPTRRLQLAAEAGGGPGRGAVLGLLLTPGDGGAAGAETRWHMAQAPDGGWRLVRRRARMAPPAAWAVTPVRGGVTATPTAAD